MRGVAGVRVRSGERPVKGRELRDKPAVDSDDQLGRRAGACGSSTKTTPGDERRYPRLAEDRGELLPRAALLGRRPGPDEQRLPHTRRQRRAADRLKFSVRLRQPDGPQNGRPALDAIVEEEDEPRCPRVCTVWTGSNHELGRSTALVRREERKIGMALLCWQPCPAPAVLYYGGRDRHDRGRRRRCAGRSTRRLNGGGRRPGRAGTRCVDDSPGGGFTGRVTRA